MATIQFTLSGDTLHVSDEVYFHLKQQSGTEFRRRSHLFVPLNKPRYRQKIGNGEVPADGFIWDLEDSIPPEQKQVARDSIVEIPPKVGNVEYCVRINTSDPEQLAQDLKAITQFPFDSVTLPKGESGAQILQLMREIGEDKLYIVTIETVKGMDAVNEIASVLRPEKDALGFGVGDMSTDLGVNRIPTYESPFFQQVMGEIALAARRYHLDLFDSVSAKFNDPEVARREATLSRHIFGFTGKKSINPKQLDAINAVYSPTFSLIEEYVATLEAFLGKTGTNAHVVGGEYAGVPAFKSADRRMRKYVRQGYIAFQEATASIPQPAREPVVT